MRKSYQFWLDLEERLETIINLEELEKFKDELINQADGFSLASLEFWVDQIRVKVLGFGSFPESVEDLL